MPIQEWQALLESEGIKVVTVERVPFHLLEPKRLVQDEDFAGALRFAGDLLRNPPGKKIIIEGGRQPVALEVCEGFKTQTRSVLSCFSMMNEWVL